MIMCVYMCTCICVVVTTEFAAHPSQLFFLQEDSRLGTVLLPALTLLVQPMPRALELCTVLHNSISEGLSKTLVLFVKDDLFCITVDM